MWTAVRTAGLGEISEIPKPGFPSACLCLFVVLWGRGVVSVVVFLLSCSEMECRMWSIIYLG